MAQLGWLIACLAAVGSTATARAQEPRPATPWWSAIAPPTTPVAPEESPSALTAPAAGVGVEASLPIGVEASVDGSVMPTLPLPPPASADLAEAPPRREAPAVRPGDGSARPVDIELQDDANPGALLLGGLLGYGVGSLLGIGVMLGMIEATDPDDGLGVLVIGIPTAVLIAGTGLAAGVTIAGDISGGNGTFGAAFGGQALGGLASVLTLLLAESSPELAIGGVIVLPIAGGMIGYALSDERRDSPRGVPWTASVTPALDGRGGLATVAGTF